jgi:hypothetical protein
MYGGTLLPVGACVLWNRNFLQMFAVQAQDCGPNPLIIFDGVYARATSTAG